MSNFKDDTTFVAELMLGHKISDDIKGFFQHHQYELRADDIECLNTIIDRVRAKILHIGEDIRKLKHHNYLLTEQVQLRYWKYEMLLIQQEYRKYNLLYKKALEEHQLLSHQDKKIA